MADDKDKKKPIDPDIGKPDMSPQPSPVDAAAQDAMRLPQSASLPPPEAPEMQGQGPSMDDLVRAQGMARDQLQAVPMRTGAAKGLAILTGHDPGAITEESIAKGIRAQNPEVEDVAQRQAFEGSRVKQILERAQGKHQIALATQEEENGRPGSAPNQATADMLNGMAGAAGKMFGEEPPVYINRNSFTNTNHLQSYSAFLDHWLSTKQAQSKEARLGPEADAKLAQMKEHLEYLRDQLGVKEKQGERGLDIKQQVANTGEENAQTKKAQVAAGGVGGMKVPASQRIQISSAAATKAASDEAEDAYNTYVKTGSEVDRRLYRDKLKAIAMQVAAGENKTGNARDALIRNIVDNAPDRGAMLLDKMGKGIGHNYFEGYRNSAKMRSEAALGGLGLPESDPLMQQHRKAFGGNKQTAPLPTAVGKDGKQYTWSPN